MKHHLMFDLETWGTLPGCAIRSIGAVIFDDTAILHTFYANVIDASCAAVGLNFDPKTQAWWRSQSPEAQAAFLNPAPLPLQQVAMMFNKFCYVHQPDCVWSHGINFDEPIWRVAADKVDRAPIWNRYATRDTRTLFALADFDLATIPNATKHNALEDARAQAIAVRLALRRLGAPSTDP